MDTVSEVEQFLAESQDTYPAGTHEYYARLALEQALVGHRAGNYGIGAVAVVVEGDTVQEFPASNALFTNSGIIDHAETLALLASKSGNPAARRYPRSTNLHTASLPAGTIVFGTLEPCPMCACALTNAGAKLSVSTVLDGELISHDGMPESTGGAQVIGEKKRLQPAVWQQIQRAIGLEFILLETQDRRLQELSRRIFEDYRDAVDTRLSQRAHSYMPVSSNEHLVP